MKVFKTALVLTLVGIFCGVLIGFAHYITDPIIKKNEAARAAEAYKGFFENLDSIEEQEHVDGSVYMVVTIKDSALEIIGYVIKGKGSNPRGLVDLAIAFDTNGNIVGSKILETENTVGFYDQYENGNDLVGLKGDNKDNLTGVDIIAGVTQTGTTLNQIINDIAKVAKEVVVGGTDPIDPYLELFEDKDTVEEDETFAPTEAVTKKEIIKDASGTVLGYAYTVSDTTVEEIPYTGQGHITFLIGVDENGIIVGIYEVENNHSKSDNFYNKYNAILESIPGTDAEDVTIDIQAGATISGNALSRIFEALKAVLV